MTGPNVPTIPVCADPIFAMASLIKKLGMTVLKMARVAAFIWFYADCAIILSLTSLQ
jgi:hypothetical protein